MIWINGGEHFWFKNGSLITRIRKTCLITTTLYMYIHIHELAKATNFHTICTETPQNILILDRNVQGVYKIHFRHMNHYYKIHCVSAHMYVACIRNNRFTTFKTKRKIILLQQILLQLLLTRYSPSNAKFIKFLFNTRLKFPFIIPVCQ